MRIKTYHEEQTVSLSLDGDHMLVESESITLCYDVRFIYAVKTTKNDLTIHTCQPALERLNGSVKPTDDETDLWQQVSKTFCFPSEEDSQLDQTAFVNELLAATQCYDSEARSATTVYAILNPASGACKAKEAWTTTVQPMLLAAGFDRIKLLHTVADGTRTLVQQQVAPSVCAAPATKALVLILGGDGTLHDVVNGLADGCKTDGTALRLGILPLGSGNAFALSLGLKSIEQATLRIIKGQTRQIRLMSVAFGQSTLPKDDAAWVDAITYPSQPTIRLLVVMSWGFHCQIVSKARYLRYVMGNKRFSLVAMALLWFLPHYEGELVMKNALRYDRHRQKIETEATTVSTRGPFTYFLASKQHSLEHGFNITPFASPFSADMDVIMLQNATANVLKQTAVLAFQGGKHVNEEKVEYYKTSELLIRVRHHAEVCLDGEIHTIPADGIVQLRLMESHGTEPAFEVFV